jgi:hypothetical protein
MTDIGQYRVIVRISRLLLILTLLIYGDFMLFIIASQLLFWVMLLRAVKIQAKKRFRFYLIFLYVLLLVAQTIFYLHYMGQTPEVLLMQMARNAMGIFILILPYLLEYQVTLKKYTEFYMPSVQDFNTLSFGQLKDAAGVMQGAVEGLGQLRQAVTPDRIIEIAQDLPRHNSAQYINEGSLTEVYFEKAMESLNDPHLYVVVSNTGSAASEILSVFTRKQYNHASLSFDRELKTIISYNGGEKVYPPGLNEEMIEFFNKKEDSSLIVYQLDASREQKMELIDKVWEINDHGSAYNMLGLVLRTSLKPNIMFCSQFVYNMLRHVGLAYFEKAGGQVKPTDLVELDYHRKLSFCYEILLGKDHSA